MAKRIVKQVKTGKLSTSLVEEFSECTEAALADTKLSRKDILRFRYSVDTAMYAWHEEVGDGADCSLEISSRFKRMTITVTCEGKKCNPNKNNDGFGSLENSSLLQSLGLTVGYSYEDGVNRLKLMPSSGFIMQLMPIIMALALGVAASMLLKTLAPDFAAAFNTAVVDPVFSSLMSVLRAIASPLIFLAVLSGIYGIGDVVSLGTIGRKLMGRFILMTFLALIVNFAILFPMMNVEFGNYSAAGDTFSEFLALVLQFIPTDIISPFLDGNMLQIITISVACGLVMLVLGERISELTKIIDQIYSVVQLLMEFVGRMVPLFIFISIFSFVLSDNDVTAKDIVLPIFGIAGTFIIMGLLVYPIVLRLKYGIGFTQLMKKILPTFIVALTTASSAAAFSSNVETCEKSLGISSNVTRFGVPLGQVVYMPIAAVEYFSLSLIMAEMWDVEISLMWIITAVFVCGVLSIATPPIPGGAMSIFTILFLQLNIPEAALPIVLSIDLLVDYVVTAGDIMCLQEELIICGDKTGQLDREKLLAEV